MYTINPSYTDNTNTHSDLFIHIVAIQNAPVASVQKNTLVCDVMKAKRAWHFIQMLWKLIYFGKYYFAVLSPLFSWWISISYNTANIVKNAYNDFLSSMNHISTHRAMFNQRASHLSIHDGLCSKVIKSNFMLSFKTADRWKFTKFPRILKLKFRG